jgi:hypothetical protein
MLDKFQYELGSNVRNIWLIECRSWMNCTNSNCKYREEGPDYYFHMLNVKPKEQRNVQLLVQQSLNIKLQQLCPECCNHLVDKLYITKAPLTLIIPIEWNDFTLNSLTSPIQVPETLMLNERQGAHDVDIKYKLNSVGLCNETHAWSLIKTHQWFQGDENCVTPIDTNDAFVAMSWHSWVLFYTKA